MACLTSPGANVTSPGQVLPGCSRCSRSPEKLQSQRKHAVGVPRAGFGPEALGSYLTGWAQTHSVGPVSVTSEED